MLSATATFHNWLTLCLVLCLCGHALATTPEGHEESESTEKKGESYETIVVSPITDLADRVPRRHWSTDADGPSAALASSVTELAAELGSLAIQETNRGSGSPILRGLIGPQNAIMLDDIAPAPTNTLGSCLSALSNLSASMKAPARSSRAVAPWAVWCTPPPSTRETNPK